WSASAYAQTTLPPLDYFRCYYIPNQPVLNIPIQLQDQFDAALPASQNFENINQLTLARICNTTRKVALLLARVRSGAEIVIEHDAEPVAILHAPARRTISECLALLPNN